MHTSPIASNFTQTSNVALHIALTFEFTSLVRSKLRIIRKISDVSFERAIAKKRKLEAYATEPAGVVAML